MLKMSTGEKYNTLAWHHFKTVIPAEWEVTAYAVEARVGRIEFSTRCGLQAVVSWEPCRSDPDLDRTMRGFFYKLAIEDAAIESRSSGRFLLGYCKERNLAQGITCMAESFILIRWIFENETARENAVQDRIMQSMEPNRGALIEYALFGLHLRIPEGFELEDAVTQPANVLLGFERPDRARLTFRRWGLPEYVLEGLSLDEYLEKFMKAQGGRVSYVSKVSFLGHDCARAEYAQRGQYQMDRFMGRPWPGGVARLWIDEDEKRLYCCQMIAPPGVELPKMEDLFAAAGQGW